MKIEKSSLILIGILIIASFLRLYHLPVTPPGLYPDEAMNGSNALESIQTGNYKVFYPENNGREGLFINIQAWFLSVTGIREPWVLRLPSALFGILTVLGLYFLGKELFSKNIGLLAAFFLAISFWHINFSRIGFRAIMAPFFITWGLFFALRALHLNTPTRKWTVSLLAGIVFGLGLNSYIAYRALPLLFVVLYLTFAITKKKIERKNILKAGGWFVIGAIIACIPLGLYFFNNPTDFLGRTSQVSIFSSATPLKDLAFNIVKTVGMLFFSGDWNWRHNIAGRAELFWPIGIFLIIGLFYEITSKKLNGKWKMEKIIPHSSFLILLLWLFLAALPVVISNEGIPHALRSILLIPPLMLFGAIGAERIYHLLKKYFHQRLRTAIVIATISLLALESYASYFITWGGNQNVQGAFAANYVSIGRAINILPQETPKYVIVKAGGTDVRGFPMSTQTVMFITDSFTRDMQREKNIHYILPEQESQIPKEVIVFVLE